MRCKYPRAEMMRALLNRARFASRLARAMGPGWMAFRAGYAVQLRCGLLERRLPAADWRDWSLDRVLADPALARLESYLAYRRDWAPAFFFTPSDRRGAVALLTAWDRIGGGPRAEADELGRGILRYFAHRPVSAGFPPDWHANPLVGLRAPGNRHWTRIGDFDYGDIKVIWEPSRFGFVYPLVRAYWRTGDNAYAERFWRLLEDWRDHNPPNRGPNWKCGQEASLRVMAWCFGLYGFLDAPATTAARVASLARIIAVTGRRIEANLGYAMSQRNNHGVSEGMGLWTIGLLFPELRQARQWRELGRRVLERLGRELICQDGSFAQHSVNYHRLMLHVYIWSLRLGQMHGRPFSAELREKVARAGELLYQIQDAETGRVPRYGQDDGALILPLSNCDYHDYRPVTQVAYFLGSGMRCHGDGPWDEDLFWLFGEGAVRAPTSSPPRGDLRAEVGGYYTLRSPSGFAFTRCGGFRHRPGHADLLHVDIWWRGQNMALDAGTYSYNAPEPWDNALSRTACHNTVVVDGECQMEQVGRFLWLPWARGRKCFQIGSPGGRLAYWVGEHDGYTRLAAPVVHRRGLVRLGDEHWLVLDELRGCEPHIYRLHWLLPDLPHRWEATSCSLDVETPAGPYAVRMGSLEGPGECSLARADVAGPRGWRATHYMSLEPALSLALDCRAEVARFWTLLGPPGATVEIEGWGLSVAGTGWEARVTLGADGGL